MHKRIASRHKNDVFNKSIIYTQAVHTSIEIRLDRNVSRVFQASFRSFSSKRLLEKARKPPEGANRIPSRQITVMETQQSFLFHTTEYEGSSTDHEGNIRQLTGKDKKLAGTEL
jgi:hypothetical protein